MQGGGVGVSFSTLCLQDAQVYTIEAHGCVLGARVRPSRADDPARTRGLVVLRVCSVPAFVISRKRGWVLQFLGLDLAGVHACFYLSDGDRASRGVEGARARVSPSRRQQSAGRRVRADSGSSARAAGVCERVVVGAEKGTSVR